MKAAATGLHITTLHGHPALLPTVCDWFMGERPRWYGPGGPGDVEADVAAMAASPDILPLGLVAWRDGQAVGVGALKAQSISSHPHLGPWAAAGYVLPALRGQGIGAALLTALAAHAARLDHARVYCATRTAVRLLSRCGWSVLEEVRHEDGPLTLFARDTPRPLAAPLCPLCGQANACAAVASGRFDVECWCRQARFPPALLARVPTDLAGRACICRACAEQAID